MSISKSTLAVWGGEESSLVQGATQVPVVYSAAYGYPDVDAWLDVALGRQPGHIYSLNTNPTVHAFEEKMRLLEGAAAATSFATGMAAISNTLFTLLSPGDRIVSVKDTYGGTNKIFTEFLPRLAALEPWNTQTVHDLFHAFVAEKAVGFGKVMAPLRLALTGVAGGPGCFEISEVIGKAETLSRIQAALENLPAQ